MSMNALIVLSVVERNRRVSEVAQEFNVSRAWVYELLRRYRIAGMAGLQPGSKRPLTNPHSLTPELHAHIAELRFTLNTQGLDAGAATIQSHLRNHTEPSTDKHHRPPTTTDQKPHHKTTASKDAHEPEPTASTPPEKCHYAEPANNTTSASDENTPAKQYSSSSTQKP